MPNTMYQVSTLQSLMMGDYEGHISIRALLKKGDTGLGTFDSLHGEMILLDGICYRALEDGHVEVSQEEDRSPFAVASFLKEDDAFPISAPDFSALQQALNARRIRQGKNNICLCRIDGDFEEIKARSEVPQTRPYRPLAVAMKTDQREFTFEHVSGSLVCVYFPPYMDKLNMAGWHIHFQRQASWRSCLWSIPDQRQRAPRVSPLFRTCHPTGIRFPASRTHGLERRYRSGRREEGVTGSTGFMDAMSFP